MADHRKVSRSEAMEILRELVSSALMLGFIVVIGIIMGALFIMVLSLATGIDSNIQQEDDRSR
jgi:ABC-type transport system involved in cytochrome bd biosynthesis fused ATPase/permease subunit